MLHVTPVLGDESKEIYRTVFGDADFCEGIDIGLYADGVLVGSARVAFEEETAVLISVALLEKCRNCGWGDFLTRAVMDAYTQSLPYFKVAYVSDYFDKFGFENKGKYMIINSENIRFPSQCKGDK